MIRRVVTVVLALGSGGGRSAELQPRSSDWSMNIEPRKAPYYATASDRERSPGRQRLTCLKEVPGRQGTEDRPASQAHHVHSLNGA